MAPILILADDLSGAADCGMACVNAGLKVIVTLGAPAGSMTVDVVAIDADTRRLGAAAAAERMRQLTQQYAGDPDLLLFKKIDSTLRGYLGAELAAVLKARSIVVPRSVAIMAPAFPVYGRTTVEGRHYVHGQPLHETEIWKREKTLGDGYIPDMLYGSGLRCALLNLARVRGARTELDRAVSDAAESSDVIVCDAETDGDLRAIAAAAAKLRGRVVWVGSAGLAHELPGTIGLALNATDEVARLPETTGSTLFVVGSASRTTRQQVAELLSTSDICGIVVPPEVLLEGPKGPRWSHFTSQLDEAVKVERDVMLTCGYETEVDVIDRPRLSKSLGEMSETLRGKVGALLISGGETARSVLDRWGVTKLQLYGELERGVCISSTVLDQIRPVTVITKAGDFGQRSTFRHCQEWLSQRGVLR
jgi:4-hydroxythreonine-4-phosphate dehydrogenase